jgi:hypothetical protein
MHILRLRAWRLSLLATLFLITLAPATFAQNRSVYAIRDARIYPVSGPLVEQGTVVIRAGLIEAIGASVRIPPEATVLDGSGLTVYLGLIDSFTDIGTTEVASANSAGGLDPDHTQWRATSEKFLLPCPILRRSFSAHFARKQLRYNTDLVGGLVGPELCTC